VSLKTAYFDCAFGAAGDMLVGACIDCGVTPEYIQSELRKLNLPVESFVTTAGKVHRASIYATKFDVWLDHKSDQKGDHRSGDKMSTPLPENGEVHGHEHCHEHSHEHIHEQSCSHSHSHSYQHSSSPSHSHSHELLHQDEQNHLSDRDKPERALSEIIKIISASNLEGPVKALACRIFESLGRAESRVHGVAFDQIHFHEVGALDAICDIVGFAAAYTKLGIEVSYVSPLPLGSGTVETRHGRYPVPGPAVLALIEQSGAMTSSFALPYECLTPTGAAILSIIATNFGPAPAFDRIDCVGYGAGSLNPGSHPNVVRIIIGQAPGQSTYSAQPETRSATNTGRKSSHETGAAEQTDRYQAEVVAVVEANIDDLAPSVMAYAMEKLLQEGALDVCLTPIVMKKGRLAQKLSVIARPDDRQKIIALILAETSTIGTRSYFCERLTLSRDFQAVSIGEGPKIRLKIARDHNGRLVNVQPEYEDCLAFARQCDTPLKEVLIRCLSKATELLDSQDRA
jgi:uncharacterized protein (TIGR00299 family) protein